MNTHLHSVSSNIRLRSIGAFAALLAWCVALFEFGAPILYWFFDYPTALAEYLNIFGEQMPSLLAPGYQPAPWIMGLVFALQMLPISLTVLALVLTGIFFMRLSKGHIWTEANIKILWWMGLLFIIVPLLAPVVSTLQGLALAIGVAPGERTVTVTVGASSSAMYAIIQGIFLCAFSLIVAESKVIDDENKSII
jgi:hypothetical protein